MLRKLVVLGVIAGSSASIPIVYQVNPETFGRLLRPAATNAPAGPERVSPTVPAAPRSQQTLAGKKVRVRADARGHFLADFKLNGRSVEALVDTGATLVAINETTARRIGIKLTSGDFTHRVDTANGSARAASAMIGNLQIGRIYVEGVQAVVLEDKALNKTLVGMSFLSRLDKYQVEDGALLLVQ